MLSVAEPTENLMVYLDSSSSDQEHNTRKRPNLEQSQQQAQAYELPPKRPKVEQSQQQAQAYELPPKRPKLEQAQQQAQLYEPPHKRPKLEQPQQETQADEPTRIYGRNKTFVVYKKNF
jgi:hypothetical protein